MSVHSTSPHFTSLHLFTLNPHLNSLACNYILNPISKRVYFRGKDASKPAGNWFQLLMVLFTKEYLPTYVLLDLSRTAVCLIQRFEWEHARRYMIVVP
jgi:hypothetical protein